MSAQTPYLCLSVPEAHSKLRAPDGDEPLDHGTLTQLLAHRATHSGDQVAAGFPACDGSDCLIWTYNDLDTIAAKYAKLISNDIGPRTHSKSQASDDTHLIAILGPSGPDFLAHVLGTWRLGAAILPIAVGTGADGIENLLRLTACRYFIVHPSLRDLAVDATASLGSGPDVRLLPWHSTACDGVDKDSKSWTSAHGDLLPPLSEITPDSKLVVFHSSGSTGKPKPIPQLHRFWTRSLTTAAGVTEAAFTTTPLFHGGLSDLFRALQAAAPIYFFAWHENKAPTVSYMLASVQACLQPIRYFLSVPYLLELLANDERGYSMLQSMDIVSTGGAPLPAHIGDRMVNELHIRLVSRLGSSECGFLMSSWREFDEDKDWSWLRNNDGDECCTNWLRFEPHSEQCGQYELIVGREWPTKIVSNQADGTFATGDLYERHSVHPHRWRYAGRADDVLVLANGKKVASSSIEAAIKTSPSVADAIVFGANRSMIGAIVLPSTDAQCLSEHEFLKRFQPDLQELNLHRSAHEQLAPEMVLRADKDLFESLPRSSKGTLQRGLAMQQVSHLIDSLYARFERGEAPDIHERIRSDSAQLPGLIKSLVAEVAGRDLGEEDDFFAAGIDSVKATVIRARLLQRLDLQGRRLPSNVVYDCGNLKMLSAFLRNSDSPSDARLAQQARKLIERYSLKATTAPQTTVPAHVQDKQGPDLILVTGGTGALGARIISHLLSTTDVRVLCLVRASDDQKARERMLLSLENRKCTPCASGWEGRLQCVSRVGESGSRTRESLLSARSLVIVHCAWMVNFALNLSSFEHECIQPLGELLQLHRDAGTTSRFLFCSSLASILGSTSPQPLEERGGYEFDCAGHTGYGQSKWVAEQICAEEPGVMIARVGQLCGDTTHGIWNETEAFPLLIRTAVEVGGLPSTGPSLDWLPVDIAAEALVEISLSLIRSSETSDLGRYVHIALPAKLERPEWSHMIDWLSTSDMLSFERCSKAAWLDRVRAAGSAIRGRALVEDIWKNLPEETTSEQSRVSTAQAEAASPTLSRATAVDRELCLKFVKSWKESGFLA